MKKLLILMLVFGMASLANAAYVPVTLTIDAPAEAVVDTEFTVTVRVTSLPTDDYMMSLAYGTIDITGGSYTEGTVAAGVTFDGASTLVFTGFSIVSAAPDPYAGEGDIVMTFTLTGLQVSDVLVFDIVDESGGYIEAALYPSGDLSGLPTDPYGLTIVGDSTHIIPEPMTVVLLGLGGLFLRRRKK